MTTTIKVIEWPQWVRLEEAHRARLLPYAEAYRNRRSIGRKHPVEDFLFQYYAYSPGQLLGWHPGIGRAISLGNRATQGQPPSRMGRSPYRTERGLVFADPTLIADAELHRVRWIASLLEAIDSRPPQVGCYGLHEWAMVYGSAQDEVRHVGMPLRLGSEEIREFLDSQRLCCTHYDAFRFFTPQAVALNTHQLDIDSRVQHEQPGCIHANMDLYKWAWKLSPWVPGELLGDCFLLAVAAREIDMRASPYDLADLGYLPIRIETPEGREAYRCAQIELYRRAIPLRRRLLAVTRRILSSRWQIGEVACDTTRSEVAGLRCDG
jgi:hypothetical protein